MLGHTCFSMTLGTVINFADPYVQSVYLCQKIQCMSLVIFFFLIFRA